MKIVNLFYVDDGYIPLWLAKCFKKHGFNHYQESKMYYLDSNPDSVMWIGGFRPSKDMSSAVRWENFFKSVFNRRNWRK